MHRFTRSPVAPRVMRVGGPALRAARCERGPANASGVKRDGTMAMEKAFPQSARQRGGGNHSFEEAALSCGSMRCALGSPRFHTIVTSKRFEHRRAATDLGEFERITAPPLCSATWATNRPTSSIGDPYENRDQSNLTSFPNPLPICGSMASAEGWTWASTGNSILDATSRSLASLNDSGLYIGCTRCTQNPPEVGNIAQA